MSKQLWTVTEQGRLLRFDGAAWAGVGNEPADWDADPILRSCAGAFVYGGRLYVRYRSGTNVVIRRLNAAGTDSEAVATAAVPIDQPNGATANQWHWGPVVNYRGRIWWLGLCDSSYLQLFCFYGDGGGAHLDARLLQTNLPASSDLAAYQSGSRATAAASAFAPALIPWGDRLFLCGCGSPQPLDQQLRIWGLLARVDIDTAGPRLVESPILTQSISHRFRALEIYGYDGPPGADPYALMGQDFLAYCSWKGALYLLTMHGQVVRCDPDTAAVTSVLDLSEATPLLMGSYTTNVNAADYGGSIAYNAVSPPWEFFRVGSLVKVGSGPSLQRGYCYHWTSNSTAIYLVERNGQAITPKNVGTPFTFYWPFGAALDQSMSRYVRMFVYNGKLHVLTCARTIGLANQTQTPPWTLHVWDGANPPTHYNLKLNNQKPTAAHLRLALDETDGVLHLIYVHMVDPYPIYHVTLDLNNPAANFTYKGVVADAGGVKAAGLHYGPPIDAAALFDAGDVTAAITGVVVDGVAETATITYVLYSSISAVTDIAVEIDYGSGWVTATQKAGTPNGTTLRPSSPAGTSQTFVHDLAGIDTVAHATAQYRIRVISQSR